MPIIRMLLVQESTSYLPRVKLPWLLILTDSSLSSLISLSYLSLNTCDFELCKRIRIRRMWIFTTSTFETNNLIHEMITINVERTWFDLYSQTRILTDPLGLSLVVTGPWVICDEWNACNGILKVLIIFSITSFSSLIIRLQVSRLRMMLIGTHFEYLIN